ncbi:MAG: type II toxin-antitoxin system RelE/ParE family toxin [Alphaproteobacteria bacterium]|nr:type II toxin-antitoxin system RelE/ParE family toxin [Alphaproteobacteria bacterium]
MSEVNYVLELSNEAYDDLINIQNYTYECYGEAKWKDYGQDLNAAMTHIMRNPLSGHARDDVPSGYQAWNVSEHVMICRIENKTIFLIRVLHNKMDFRFQF